MDRAPHGVSACCPVLPLVGRVSGTGRHPFAITRRKALHMKTAMRLLCVSVAMSWPTYVLAAQYSFSRIYTGPVSPGVAINENGLVASLLAPFSPDIH